MALRKLKRGSLLLAQAIVSAGHTREDALEGIGISAGGLSHVLNGSRGVGLDLGLKIQAAYPAVGIESWTIDATPAEMLLARETLDKIQKRKRAPGSDGAAHGVAP